MCTETDRGGWRVPYAPASPHLLPEIPRPRHSLVSSLPPSLQDDASNWVQGDLGNWEGRDGIWQAPMAPVITLIRVVNGIPSGMQKMLKCSSALKQGFFFLAPPTPPPLLPHVVTIADHFSVTL